MSRLLRRSKKKRRLSDKLRQLADLAWARGDKATSESLHQLARQKEAERSEHHA